MREASFEISNIHRSTSARRRDPKLYKGEYKNEIKYTECAKVHNTIQQ
jgi:hypothetical protein